MDEAVLIEKVTNYECLFNVNSKNYRNECMRQETWEEIGREMNSTDFRCIATQHIRASEKCARVISLKKMDEAVLIEKVRNYECLFNVNSKNYRNQCMRQEAWEEIGREMNSTAASIRNGWTKLRNAFINAKKRRKTKSGQAAKKLTPWKFEQEMSFLLPFLETRETHSNLQSQQDVELNSEDEKEEEDVSIDAGNTSQYEVTDENTENSTEIFENEEESPIAASVPLSVEKKVRRSSKVSTGNPAQEIVRIMKQNAELRNAKRSLPKPLPEYDEVEMFYLSMAKTVKRLPEMDQAKIRMELCKMVSEAEINQMTMGNSVKNVERLTSHNSPLSSSASSRYSSPMQSPPIPTQFNTLVHMQNSPFSAHIGEYESSSYTQI